MPVRRLILLLCLFAVGGALAFAGAVALTWWVDPQHERYDPSLLTRAEAAAKPCLMTTEAVGDSPAIADFKLDVLRRQDPSLIVLGISRSLEIRSWPGEKGFANMGTPGLGPAAALTVVERVHGVHPGPVTVYLDMEPAWTNGRWSPFLDFGLTPLQRLRRYVSSAGLLASVRFLARHPGADPAAVAMSEEEGHCVLHPPGQSADPPFWYSDGSIQWAVAGKVDAPGTGVGVAGLSYLDPARLAQVERLVARMHQLGWHIIGFTPPVAPWKVALLHSRPADERSYARFDAAMRRLLARYGASYVDFLQSPQTIACKPANFSAGDALHPDGPCSARLRRVLDRMAAREASQAS
jgi:hypothetical protein